MVVASIAAPMSVATIVAAVTSITGDDDGRDEIATIDTTVPGPGGSSSIGSRVVSVALGLNRRRPETDQAGDGKQSRQGHVPKFPSHDLDLSQPGGIRSDGGSGPFAADLAESRFFHSSRRAGPRATAPIRLSDPRNQFPR